MKFKITPELGELVGIIIGDGCLYFSKKFNKYYIEIVGDPRLDRDYFEYISYLVEKTLNKKPTIAVRSGGLRLRFYSKEFLEFLIYTLKMPFGKIKGSIIKIPKKLISNKKEITKKCIRGIADSDGSLFLANKKYRLDYPVIEIKSISKNLMFQLKFLLEKEGFRLGLRRENRVNCSKVYVLSINGEIMVKKWIEEIGFSSSKHFNKYSQLPMQLQNI